MMAGRPRTRARVQMEKDMAALVDEPLKERVLEYALNYPGQTLVAIASRFNTTSREVEKILGQDERVDVILTTLGRKAVPVMFDPERYSKAVRKRARGILMKSLIILSREGKLDEASPTALATLMPVLVRMIDGDLALSGKEKGDEALDNFTVEELSVFFKKVVRKVRRFAPTVAGELEDTVEKIDEISDADFTDAVKGVIGGAGNPGVKGAGGGQEGGGGGERREHKGGWVRPGDRRVSGGVADKREGKPG